MCELTHEFGDFARRVFEIEAAPVKFGGYVFHRTPAEQAEVNAKASQLADAAVRALRAQVADDKRVFEAFGHVAFEIEYRHHEQRAALADAYRTKDHAELGRIVAERMRERLEDKAKDEADEECFE